MTEQTTAPEQSTFAVGGSGQSGSRPLDYAEWTGRFAAVIETILNFDEWGISRNGALKLARQALNDYEAAKAA